jgi:bacterioferritin-associated ferredoxin
MDLNTIFNSFHMFVCLCHVTTDSEVRRVIDRGARTVDEVGDACGAGTGCGACRSQIHDMLEAAGRECERACADCPRSRISVALPLTADSREAA